MDEKNRPQGRKKNIGEGTASVEKRGSGLSGRTQGPVGNSSGYSERTGGNSSGRPVSSLGRDQRTGRKGVLGKPRASQHQGGTGTQRHPGVGYSGGTGRSSRGAASLLTSLFTGKGKSPKLITIILIIAVIYLLFTKLGGNNSDLLGTVGSVLSGDGLNTQTSTQTAGQSSTDNGPYKPNMSVSKLARSKRTVLQGGGRDVATIMVYMCATDLEANYGMATSDIQEMLASDIGDNVNIIIETGGALSWKNNAISNKTNQRYKVTSDGLKLIQDGLGKKSMVEPSTLSDFIKYCKDKYPADRYALIFWDHGGGSVSGYGYDQHFPNNSMTLDEIGLALKNGNCEFDFVGFDACLMATLETALVLEPYADYMIASEEVEPGIGWHYTGWINTLSKNTSISTVELGKKMIDDYVKEVKERTPSSQATLSLIDLAELKGTVPSSFVAFAKSTGELIDKDEYKYVSDARASTKEFSPSAKLHQIDLIHFTENMGTAEAEALSEALRGCVKYNRTSTNITNSNGVSIFFPYGTTSKLNSALSTYDKIGIDAEYSDCIKSFSSFAVGGQVTSSGSNNLLSTLLSGLAGGQQAPATSGSSGSDIVGSLLSSFLSGQLSGGSSGSSPATSGSGLAGIATELLGSWLDTGRMKAAQDYYEENRIDASALVITYKDGQRVLALPDAQWELIQYMEMNVFVDDGEGFIDLGLDNVYEYNDDGDLIMEYDGTWLALNGQIVSYYMMSEDRDAQGNYSIRGRVPAFLNDRLVDIIIVFDNDNPDGKVLGAQTKYDPETETETLAKGLIDIAAGDKIDFLCDYYTYEGDYNDTYYLGEQYTATGDWEIENLSIADMKYQMTYRITDIYGNNYWTQSVSD